MNLELYLKKINKDKCFEGCEFKRRKDIEIALVPPPKKILGIIISQDPTTRWLDYEEAKEKPENIRRKILFDTAIPLQVIKKIAIFMGRETAQIIKETMYKNMYWTHIHKCFTDKSGRVSIKYKYKNARHCANKWLADELNIAINNRPIFIVTLGKPVKKWIDAWKEDNCENKDVKVINLPHPSPANVGIKSSWNPNTEDREEIEQQINNLLELCKAVG